MFPELTIMTSSVSTPVLNRVQVESSTTSSIHLTWQLSQDSGAYVQGFRVHYQKEASKYIQYGPMLGSSQSDFNIQNLVADTYYKVCLVIYRNDTISPFRECIDAATTNWRIPVSISIGSSIGAVLALSMIVLIVLAVARCPFVIRWHGRQKPKTRKYDSMSSHFHYEFSDTVTHDHDDEYTSEQSEGMIQDGANHSYRHEYRIAERLCNGSHNHVTLQHLQQNKCVGARPKVQISNHFRHPSYIFQNTLMTPTLDLHSNHDCHHDPQYACNQDCNHNHHDGSIVLHTQNNTFHQINPNDLVMDADGIKHTRSDSALIYHVPADSLDQDDSVFDQSETPMSVQCNDTDNHFVAFSKNPDAYEMKKFKSHSDSQYELKPKKLLETAIDETTQ